MKKYRLNYDKLFIAKGGIEGFEYKGEIIEALQIYFEYRVLDETGYEKFFTCSDDEEMKEQLIDGYDLNSFYKCCFDRDNKCGYTMTPTEIAEKSDFDVIYNVDCCFKVLRDEAYPTLISYEEFCDILLNNTEHLDISGNKPTQSVSYVANEIKEPDVSNTKELDILTMAAVITGVNISEINRLPQEIKADIIAEFQENNGTISTEQLAERICEIADIEPPEIIKPTEPDIKPQENKEKENPLRDLEDMLEENDNYIDGILNNLPPEKPKEQKYETSKDEPLFSRTKIMSDDFKPTSEKSQEDIDKNKSKKHNIGI